MGVSLYRLAIGLFLVGLLSGSGVVRAETAASIRGADAATTSATEQASRARQLFSEQKYIEAAEALQRAFAADPKPLYLFNAGTAYRKAENRQESLQLYQRYLEVAPDGPLAGEARNYVKDLTALVAAQERLQGTTQLLESERTKQDELEQALRKERRKPIYKRPWFIVTVMTLAVGGIVGVGFAGYFQNKKQQSQIILQPTF